MLYPLLSALLIADLVTCQNEQHPLSSFKSDAENYLGTSCERNTETGHWFCPLLEDKSCFIADERGRIVLTSSLPVYSTLHSSWLGGDRISSESIGATIGLGAIGIGVPADIAEFINKKLGATRRGQQNVIDCNTLHALPNISFTLSHGLGGLPQEVEWSPSSYVVRVGGGCFSPFSPEEYDAEIFSLSSLSESSNDNPLNRASSDDFLPTSRIKSSLRSHDQGHSSSTWQIGEIYFRGTSLLNSTKQDMIVQLDEEQISVCAAWREEGAAMCQADLSLEEKEEYLSMRTMNSFSLTGESFSAELSPVFIQPGRFFMHVPTRIALRFNEILDAHEEGSYWAVDCNTISSLPDLTFSYTQNGVTIPNNLRAEEYIVHIGGLCLSPFLDIGTEFLAFDIGDVFVHHYGT